MPFNFPFDISESWTFAAVVTLTTFSLLLALRAFIGRQLKKLATRRALAFLSYPEQLLGATSNLFLFAVSALAGLSQMEFAPQYQRMLHYAWVVIGVLQAALWANRLLSVSLERAFETHRASNPSSATHLLAVGLLLRIVLWSVAVLLVLDNLGFNITTLAASLGIGGVAVALAVQNILGDIFSSVSIALDKPFVIGDFIVVDDFMGTVEYVGLKTTRIRSLGGEQIVFSNTELLKKKISNFKRMEERRIAFEFGIAHETSLENIEKVPGLVEAAIRTGGFQTRFDRSHFKAFTDRALVYENVYYVLTPDFNVYMDIQQQINLTLMREFRRLGIELAYPVQKIHVVSAPAEPSAPDRASVPAKPPARHLRPAD
ncbi:MAG TPA: mechanosensitive ion channel family protein [Noviherbaspirillum sp.]|jgi:small-conductance mechanosensitive channel|uniref:mechanosensitive ion channel family protein n=1 Tax=Noviherbaspirillum sp. TaxID=1926288 RepID=UPI002F93CCD0